MKNKRPASSGKPDEPDFLAVDTPSWEGILLHGSYHERRGLGVDESVTWGDYFLLEAVTKALALA